MTNRTINPQMYAFSELATAFGQGVAQVNNRSKLLTFYQLPSELIISCPTQKNILLIQLLGNNNKLNPYILKFTYNDQEKATFRFDVDSNQDDLWFEVSYSSGLTHLTSQELVQYWIPRMFLRRQ